MRTPVNQDSFENEIARGRVNVPDFKNEIFFFLLLQIKKLMVVLM